MTFVKLALVITLLMSFGVASTLSDKYIYAKKNYVTAVLKNNKEKEVIYLKQIISYGSKLGKNVDRYKKQLRKYDKSIKTKVQRAAFKPKLKPTPTKSSYDIKSVYTDKNAIIINFTRNISIKDIDFIENKIKNGAQDIFDITGRFEDARPTKLRLDTIDKITILQYRYNTLRIILSHRTNPKTIYIVNKKQIIIKVLDTPKPKRIKVNKPKPKVQKLEKKDIGLITSDKVIVLDAGHGGKDPGAVGPRKRYEKHVTLGIAKYVRDELKSKGFKVYMTRSRDKSRSLRYRTKYANRKNADVFISIHANSTVKRNAHKAKGVETYFLSPARSARAKRVAAIENQEDMNSMSYNSKNILLTLLNRSKIISSQKMAIDIQSHMLYDLKKSYGKKIVDGGVREAPFWVLVGAQMPAVLIEVGYISHPTESRRIYSKTYQKRIARGIAKGIISYFTHNP